MAVIELTRACVIELTRGCGCVQWGARFSTYLSLALFINLVTLAASHHVMLKFLDCFKR